MGASETCGSCLLEMVVRMSRDEEAGTRSSIRCRKSETVEDESVGSERVGGRSRPPKLVMRTLRLWDAILRNMAGINVFGNVSRLARGNAGSRKSVERCRGELN